MSAGNRARAAGRVNSGGAGSAEEPQERLANAYRRLLFTYPDSYRRERGDELVGTMMDGARPGQRRPTVAEAVDLILGGLRRQAGLWRLVLPESVTTAGAFALALAVGLSAFWVTSDELLAEPNSVFAGTHPMGPFHTIGPVAYAAWLFTLAMVTLVGRRARWLILLPLAVTAVLPYLAEPLGLAPPWGAANRLLLVLGVGALAMPAWPTRRQRIAIAAGAGVTTAVAWIGGLWAAHSSGSEIVQSESTVGTGLAATMALLAFGYWLLRRCAAPWLARLGLMALAVFALGAPATWLSFAFG